ncbi:MAG TPA: response regulator transcription factor [Anaerolineales bacterium]|nr:response regulator transcription factor [Anaerolineales bacterium]
MTTAGLRVLVVDDERAIRRYLRAALSAQGMVVVEASSGEEALRAAAVERPEVVILDLGLPDLDGLEVTRRMREWTDIPIIILSVREQESEKVAALDAGADDYLTKPFGISELMARIRASLRRSARPAKEPVIEIKELRIDLERRQVTVAGEEVALTPTEYDILRLLAQNSGKVLTHRQLLHTVWGNAFEDDLHILRVNISNIRRKIEPDPTRPSYIQTEAGVGYRLRSED